jgi:hypothetical protein
MRPLGLVCALSIAACSAGSTPTAGGATHSNATTGTTWNDGQMLNATVTIAAGESVTIAPGATITVAAGVGITVAGSLSAQSAAATHARLVAPANWAGILVAPGGSLALDGVDLVGANTAIEVQAGATQARYDHGIIDGATTPFQIDSGAALTTTGAVVVHTQGMSTVAGSLTAARLDYDANMNQGFMVTDAVGLHARLSVEDSKLHGAGQGSSDMVVVGTGASLHVARSEVYASHCGFHFSPIDAFDITLSNIHDCTYGFMLYGSEGPGPRTVTNSNVVNNLEFAFDTTPSNNGPITFDHCYVMGTQQTGGIVTVTNPQPSAVAGTGPSAP